MHADLSSNSAAPGAQTHYPHGRQCWITRANVTGETVKRQQLANAVYVMTALSQGRERNCWDYLSFYLADTTPCTALRGHSARLAC